MNAPAKTPLVDAAASAPPSPSTYQVTPIAAVEESKTNPRKTFVGLDELAASERKHGIIVPLLVRPHPKPRGLVAWELVAGARRLRAGHMAKLVEVPILIRELTDLDVLEIQIIENLQRADVHPMEEAECYEQMVDKHGFTVETIAAKIGKSTSYVHARRKFTDLCPEGRKLFLEGKLDASRALIMARIPGEKSQKEFAADILRPQGWNFQIDTDIDDDGSKRETRPMTVREAQLHAQRKYMLRLEQAPFPINDATLLPKAGSCTDCPKRTGNQRELFADVKSADVCTDAVCFDAKKKADWDRKAAAATRDGQRVLNDKETKNVFVPYGGSTEIRDEAAYVDPKAKLPYNLDSTGKKTWGSLLGSNADKVSKAIAKDGTGAARELLDKKSAIATLQKTGKLKEVKAESNARKAPPDKYALEQAKKRREAERRNQVARLAFAELEKKGQDAAGVPFWKWLARSVLRMIDAEDCRNLCKRRELDTKLGSGDAEKALAKVILEKKTVDELLGLIVEFASAFRAVGGVWAGRNYGDNFTGAVEVLGIDLAKLGKQLDAAKKDKDKPAVAAKSKPAKKKGGGK